LLTAVPSRGRRHPTPEPKSGAVPCPGSLRWIATTTPGILSPSVQISLAKKHAYAMPSLPSHSQGLSLRALSGLFSRRSCPAVWLGVLSDLSIVRRVGYVERQLLTVVRPPQEERGHVEAPGEEKQDVGHSAINQDVGQGGKFDPYAVKD